MRGLFSISPSPPQLMKSMTKSSHHPPPRQMKATTSSKTGTSSPRPSMRVSSRPRWWRISPMPGPSSEPMSAWLPSSPLWSAFWPQYASQSWSSSHCGDVEGIRVKTSLRPPRRTPAPPATRRTPTAPPPSVIWRRRMQRSSPLMCLPQTSITQKLSCRWTVIRL